MGEGLGKDAESAPAPQYRNHRVHDEVARRRDSNPNLNIAAFRRAMLAMLRKGGS